MKQQTSKILEQRFNQEIPELQTKLKEQLEGAIKTLFEMNSRLMRVREADMSEGGNGNGDDNCFAKLSIKYTKSIQILHHTKHGRYPDSIHEFYEKV